MLSAQAKFLTGPTQTFTTKNKSDNVIIVMLPKEKHGEHKKVERKTYIFKLQKQDTSEPG